MSKYDPRGVLCGLPRRIKVAGTDYAIKVATPRARKEIDGNHGICLHTTREILLDKEMVREGPPDLILNTVMHEVSHAVNSFFSVVDGVTEEHFTEYHTNGIVALYLDNPGYVEWITRLLSEIRSERTSQHESH